MIHKNTILASAEISENYRYWLKREWDTSKETGVFIALNPSKATDLKCDQTMCNINNLSIQWGRGGFYILNLFAFMATKKQDMLSAENPVGDENDEHIARICKKYEKVILSWGEEKPKRVADRANVVKNILKDLGKEAFCLSENKSSGYRHPCIIDPEDYKKPKPISLTGQL